jgi:ketosteroid isomerase-like protein
MDWSMTVSARLLLPTAFVAITALATSACSGPPQLAADDGALRALDHAYAEAWLTPTPAEQQKKVLALFDTKAVIMPGGGGTPAEGLEDIAAFWFPTGASPTSVTHFNRDIESVEVAGDLGIVSGRYTLSFTHEGRTHSQSGNYMFVARFEAGAWRITRMIWNDQPLTDV